MTQEAVISMGLYGPSLTEKIRHSAATTLQQAEWKIDVDWSTGSKLHKLRGTVKEQHSDAETMQLARNVWGALTKEYRLDPKDGRDGLLDVYVTSASGAVQSTGVNG
jgi:hypothetical protein